MRAVITGGTGLIGRALAERLAGDGWEVVVLTRSRTGGDETGPIRKLWWPAGEEASEGSGFDKEWRRAVETADAVVHLAGEPIASRRWNDGQKQRILQSRVRGTRALVEAMRRSKRKPAVLVSGSAVGYYGPCGDEVITEEKAPGSDFLSEVCVRWEAEAQKAERFGVRVVRLRIGLVLEKEQGALPRMLLPFRWFIGGPIGSGKQWMSWIHLEDLVGLMGFLLADVRARGAVNGVAPNPVTNREFSRILGKVMGRPSWLPVPAPVLRWAFGELADALLLSGQRVFPEKALACGYTFRYPDLESALRDVLG